MFKRSVQENIEQWLFKGKVIVLYGARQVGKTTLSKEILKKYADADKNFVSGNYSLTDKESSYKYLNCDLIPVRKALEVQDDEALRNYIGADVKLVVIDEAQRVENIGLILKILVDTYPEIQIIATGSSSFELSNKIKEPLTGRAIQFMLYPLSIQELSTKYDSYKLDIKLESLLRFGSYPAIVDESEEAARTFLESIASNYLYKDILEFEQVKNSKALFNLLELLALQVGNEVSYQELASNLDINVATVKRYIDLLEKCFVVFTLHAFSRNKRKEITKSVKIYFYDVGIRNALIQGFNRLDMRTDIGSLWENFCIVERLKFNQANKRYINKYFWRNYEQKEIDYIEEHDGFLEGYEFKWGKEARKYRPPKAFVDNYDNATVKRIDRQNYQEFLT